jgi:hypothetical protein
MSFAGVQPHRSGETVFSPLDLRLDPLASRELDRDHGSYAQRAVQVLSTESRSNEYAIKPAGGATLASTHALPEQAKVMLAVFGFPTSRAPNATEIARPVAFRSTNPDPLRSD